MTEAWHLLHTAPGGCVVLALVGFAVAKVAMDILSAANRALFIGRRAPMCFAIPRWGRP